MRKRMKSLLSFLLAIVMLVSAIPVMSTAEEFDPQPAVTGTEVIDPKESQDEPLADCSILKYVDEKEFESHGFLQRCPAEEELNTYVFQLEGGQRAVYFLDENVKFVDETGLILEKDLTLVEGEGGYKTACNDIDVTLPLLLADGISFKYSDVSITVRPVTDKEASAESDERYVEYRDAFGDGTSLVYTPTLSGLKEDIVIDSKDAPETYSFTMYTNGLKLFSDGEGLYLAADEDAEEKVRLGSVQLYDSGDRMGRGEIITEAVSEGEEYIITLVPDQEFLQDERTVYPVTIDPTLTVSDNTYGNNAILDAPIFSGQPNDNFGDYRYDRLGTPTDVNYGIGRTVVKLPGLTGSTAYNSIATYEADNRILKVLFCVKESYGTASTQTIKLHPITGGYGWTEAGVKWNTIGTSFNSNVNFGTTMTNNEWSKFDITDLVIGWKQYTYSSECGFIMLNANESNNECFDSCESYTQDYKPYVLFVYDSYITITGSKTRDVTVGSCIQLYADRYPQNSTVTWTSSDTSIASVSSTGKVTGIKASSAPVTITATILYNGTYHSDTCSVFVALPNGTYYLKNRQTSRFADIEGPTMAAGTDIHQWEFNGNNSQRWTFTHIEHGLYTIKSNNSTSYYYMGVSGNSTSSGAQIELCTGDPDVNDGMRWRLYITSQGAYKLMAVTGITNGLVAQVMFDYSPQNGWKIKQSTYGNDSNYTDEWYIIDCDHIYGSKQFREFPTGFDLETVNCMGYAMGIDEKINVVNYDTNGDGNVTNEDIWDYRATQYWLDLKSDNVHNPTGEMKSTLSGKCKQDFEDWLTNKGYTWNYESSFSSNGETNPLLANQYRVVLRTGLNWDNVSLQLYYDYHFWYQTADGTWANKHAGYAPVRMDEGVTPFTTATSEWDYEYLNGFYDGTIYVYIITVE